MKYKYPYQSLDDFLKARILDVDGILDDGFGAIFNVKGRIIDAVILFADMCSFSSRSQALSPVETLILVNNFFSWMAAEGLNGRLGIVDKYIGDEVMVIFSKEFGSKDPFSDAVNAARWMAEKDFLGFGLHAGIAAGSVVIGYVGTPIKYDCSVYGSAVTIARRCCQVKAEGLLSSIVMPASLWKDKRLEDVFEKGEPNEKTSWEVLPIRKEILKHNEPLEVVEIASQTVTCSLESAEQRAKKAFDGLKKDGSFKPRRADFEEIPEILKQYFGIK
jgi:hypothetical protein